MFNKPPMPQWASALGAAGVCTLRIKGTIAVARYRFESLLSEPPYLPIELFSDGLCAYVLIHCHF